MKNLLALLLLFSTPASAEVANPNLLPFGEEEALLGNAGIAHSESTGATFYNPGALGFVRQKKVSVYGNAYMAEKARVRAGYNINGTEVPIASHTFAPVPLGSVSLLGNEKNSYAFSILVPHTLTYDFQIPFRDSSANMNYVGSFSSTSLWFGPSYARRASERFAWGASWFVIRHSGSNNSIVYINKPSAPAASGAFGSRRRTVEWSTLLVLGAQWNPAPAFTFGARVQTATLSLRGRTDFFRIAEGSVLGTRVSQLENEQGIHSVYKLPFNFGVGGRFSPSSRLDLLLDLNAQTGLRYQSNPSHPSIGQNVRTRFRPRANFGAKWRLTPKQNVLMGFLYNPSTLVDDVTFSGTLDQENYKGITGGFQFDSGVLVTSVGGFFLWSNGIYRTSDVFGTVTNLSPVEHQYYGLLLTASYKL